jgi:membrane protein implicated in regulation of membrane protease activity
VHDYAGPGTNGTTPSTYHWLLLVLLGLSLLMLVGAWLRKRLLLAFSLAFYGVSMLQLGKWEFAIPFAIAGAYYLVKVYRLSQELKRAQGDDGPPRARGGKPSNGARPRRNKRYTPPR